MLKAINGIVEWAFSNKFDQFLFIKTFFKKSLAELKLSAINHISIESLLSQRRSKTDRLILKKQISYFYLVINRSAQININFLLFTLIIFIHLLIEKQKFFDASSLNYNLNQIAMKKFSSNLKRLSSYLNKQPYNLQLKKRFQQNATDISQLDGQTQQILSRISNIDPIMKVILFQNSEMKFQKYIPIQGIFFGFLYKGLFYSTRLNSPLNIAGNKQCDEGLFVYNPTCRQWFIDAANQESLSIHSPIISYGDSLPFAAQSICQKMVNYNQQSNQNQLSHVLCIESKISKIKNYFQNLVDSTKKFYIISPFSQLVIFDTSENFNSESLELQTLQQVEFNQLDIANSDIQLLQQTLNICQNKWAKQSYDYVGHKILNDLVNQTVVIPYKRNGIKHQAIIDPVFIVDKIPYYNGNVLKNKKTLVELVYIQINIISDEELLQYQKKIIFLLDNYFLEGGIFLLICTLASIFISFYYSVQIINLIYAPINHLLKILKKIQINISNPQICSIISSYLLNEEDIFLSLETYDLYMSFSSIFNMLLLSSENIYKDNQAKTLLKLCQNLDFLQKFQNYYAVGITYNNIGGFLQNQSEYFHALESYQSSIQYAKYEIQKFCNENPFLAKTSGLHQYCFDFQYRDNDQLDLLRRQTELKRRKKKVNVNDNKSSIFFIDNYQGQKVGGRCSILGIIKTIKNKLQTIFQSNKIIQKEIRREEIQNQILQNDQKNFQIEENDQQQIIQLYSNYFYRKMNFVFTLIAYQESTLKNSIKKNSNKQNQIPCLNLWHETKDLIKELKKLSENLPIKVFIEGPLNYLEAKCYYRLKSFTRAEEKINYCNQLLDQIKNNQRSTGDQNTVKSKINSINKNMIQERISYQKIKSQLLKQQQKTPKSKLSFNIQNQNITNQNLFKKSQNQINNHIPNYTNEQNNQIRTKISNFLKQNSTKNQDSMYLKTEQIEKSPQTQHSNITFQNNCINDYSSICKVVIRENNLQDSMLDSSSQTQRKLIQFINSYSTPSQQIVANSQFSQKLKSVKSNQKSNKNQQESFALIIDNQQRANNASIQQNNENPNQTFTDAFQRFKEQESEAPLFSRYDLESYFAQKQKEYQTNLEKNNSQIQLFIQTIEMTLGFYLSEFYFEKKDYLQAANQLSQIFENNQRILAQFPYRIVSYLRSIFNKYGILSPELNQIQSKLSKNQPMKLAIIIDSNGNNETNIQSLKIISDVFNEVLYKQHDQIAIIIQNNGDNIIENYMNFVKVSSIKGLLSMILSDVNSIISTIQSQEILIIASEILEKEHQLDDEIIQRNKNNLIKQQQQQQNTVGKDSQDLQFTSNNVQQKTNQSNQTYLFQNQFNHDQQLKQPIPQLIFSQENQRTDIIDQSNNQSLIDDHDPSQNAKNQIFQQQSLDIKHLIDFNTQREANQMQSTQKKQNSNQVIQQENNHLINFNQHHLHGFQIVKVDFALGDMVDQSKINISNDDISDSSIFLEELHLNVDNSFNCNTLNNIQNSKIQKQEILLKKNKQFHLLIRQTISQLLCQKFQFDQIKFNQFKNHFRPWHCKKKLFQQQENKIQDLYHIFEYINKHQQRINRVILYCTDKIEIIKNQIFDMLCFTLFSNDILLVIFASQKGISFLELEQEQDDGCHVYHQKVVIRIFYSTNQLTNYLQSQRNQFSKKTISTYLQHF